MGHLHPLDLVVIVAYLVGMFLIGLYCTRLVKTQKDLFLGGRRFGKWMLTFQSFGIGTQSEHVIAVVGQCYKLGLAGIWWQFLWLFATPVYWMSHPLLRRMRMTTTADYWAERFSPALGYFAAVMGVLQITFNIATILKGMGRVIEPVTAGIVTEAVVVPVATILFVCYGIMGGLYAATLTDVFQGILTLVLSLLLLPFIFSAVGGMSGLHATLDPSKFTYTVPGEMTLFYIAMLSLNALVGIYTGPHTMTNLGSGRNEWEVRVGSMAGTLLKRFCTVAWAFLGLGALALLPSLAHEEEAFARLFVTLLPPGLSGLMISALLATAMSTCDASMLSGAALVTRNLYQPLVRGRSERHYLLVGRVASFLIVASAALIAFLLSSVLDGMKVVWTIYAFMGLAWWGGVLWPRTTTAAAWTSSLVTALAYLATVRYNQVVEPVDRLAYPQQIAIYLVCGLMALIVTSYLTTHREPAKVRRFYAKMRTPTTQPSPFDQDE